MKLLSSFISNSFNTHIQLIQIFQKRILGRRTFFVHHETPLPSRGGKIVHQKGVFKKTGSVQVSYIIENSSLHQRASTG